MREGRVKDVLAVVEKWRSAAENGHYMAISGRMTV